MQKIRITPYELDSMRPTQKITINPTLRQTRFIKSCLGESTDQTPIWFMRQAGRYMAEYRAIRAKHSMLDVINSPELSAEVTMQPINAFGFDAAIIFSDILPLLTGMGLKLDFIPGKGPQIENPLDSTKAIDMLATPPAEVSMQGTLDAIKLVAPELEAKNTPLIGFCGAPFTLASYAIEGGGSKVYAKTKALMYTHPSAWQRLMDKLVTVQVDYLVKQVKAGASALQLFDSWAGAALSKADYIQYVQPYNTKIFAAVKRQVDAPFINFSTGTHAYLEDVAACGGDVLGADWRMPLSNAFAKAGDMAVMGNLDPIALLAPWRELRYRIDQVLAEAEGHDGYIFNLGHGILPNTPIENVQRTVDYVRSKSRE